MVIRLLILRCLIIWIRGNSLQRSLQYNFWWDEQIWGFRCWDYKSYPQSENHQASLLSLELFKRAMTNAFTQTCVYRCFINWLNHSGNPKLTLVTIPYTRTKFLSCPINNHHKHHIQTIWQTSTFKGKGLLIVMMVNLLEYGWNESSFHFDICVCSRPWLTPTSKDLCQPLIFYQGFVSERGV